MKIIKIDNYGRDTVDDVLVCENLNEYYGKIILHTLINKLSGEDSDAYFKLVEDDYVLYAYQWD